MGGDGHVVHPAGAEDEVSSARLIHYHSKRNRTILCAGNKMAELMWSIKNGDLDQVKAIFEAQVGE